MIKPKSNLAIFAYTIIFFIIPSFASAQLSADISLNPENPSPYSSVNLVLGSYSFNVNTANIIWSSRGKKLLSGLGEKTLTVKLGAAGESFPVEVSATTADKQSFSSSVTIVPESVELLYESDESDVPIFYEGRSLPGEGAKVRVTAVPSMSEGGSVIPKSSLSYGWYLNDTYIDSASGAGKQMAIFSLDYLNDSNTVKVRVSSPGGSVAEKEVIIYPHAVMPMFYTYDAVLGMNYGISLERRLESTKEFTIGLEPYFLSNVDNLRETASYSWFLDGLPITPDGGLLLSFNPKANSYGSRSLLVDIQNSKRRLQTAKATLDLVFDTRK